MDILKRSAQIVVVVVILLAAGLSRPAGAAEDATIKAFSAWQGQGHLFETGPAELTFVGALTGTMYIDTEKGPLAAGEMVCPAVVTVNTDDGTQDGKGRCVITATDGARVYAEISCSGLHLIGCDGDFKLNGGTGRFQGIRGGGHVTIHSEFGQVSPLSKAATQEEATGVLYLRELRYTIP